jgi:hypothetical protein
MVRDPAAKHNLPPRREPRKLRIEDDAAYRI